MSKKKILYVTQEMKPFTDISEMSRIVRELAQSAMESGMEVRILMPRFGTINERRHRLHEVVRLSGMNIIVDDDDYPLIIKVASLPGARLQVYFLDNEEFFKRKQIFEDANGKPFDDNQERMIFFCKGVIETVKKFGWPPDVIHCHGWMTSLIPVYIKRAYKTEPLFQNSKVVYSAYPNEISKTFNSDFIEKAQINNLEEEDLTSFQKNGEINLIEGVQEFADNIVLSRNSESDNGFEAIEGEKIRQVEYKETPELVEQLISFYDELTED
ncbi:MAG: starch synthase [Saprospirales bacterium]|nr:MAG: starch synthase [Saprospirales bacterium]